MWYNIEHICSTSKGISKTFINICITYGSIEMKYKKMCHCTTPKIKQKWMNNPNPVGHIESMYESSHRSQKVKRKRLVCSECKRRIISSIRVCNDGCCIIHELPIHKPKGWMKKKNRQPRKSGRKKGRFFRRV